MRVWLQAADLRHVTLLGLLDMSAAFDCVDHAILLQRLRSAVGLYGVVLNWIDSFLSGRTQHIVYNGQLSTTQFVLFGDPHGSLLYILYLMSSLDMDFRFISTRTTARFISARQSTTPRLLSTSCQHA